MRSVLGSSWARKPCARESHTTCGNSGSESERAGSCGQFTSKSQLPPDPNHQMREGERQLWPRPSRPNCRQVEERIRDSSRARQRRRARMTPGPAFSVIRARGCRARNPGSPSARPTREHSQTETLPSPLATLAASLARGALRNWPERESLRVDPSRSLP